MKESKRTKGLYFRCSKEFLQLADMLAGSGSIADAIHSAVSAAAIRTVDPGRWEMSFEEFMKLCHTVGETDDKALKREKQKVRNGTLKSLLTKKYSPK